MIAGTYWYQSTASICPAPLSYRLGNIDQSFSITTEEARSAVAAAEALWEDATGRDLFVYDESSDFTVDFVFDERQIAVDSEISERVLLDEQKQTSEQVRDSLATLQKEYGILSSSYAARAKQYEDRLFAYNTEVGKYNDRGGAPEDVFAKLEEERQAITAEAAVLAKLDSELGSMAKEINRLGAKGNQLVEDYNQEVQQYNEDFGFRGEFTQGDFQGDKIHIYTFTSATELITVLAHELGHTLGIGHVDGTSSLMYYLLDNTSSSPVLSGEDLVAYQTVCGVTESNTQKIRRHIRQVIGMF